MRAELTDDGWTLIAPLLPPERGRPGRPSHCNRSVLEGIFWIIRSGARWVDVPERFGRWNSVYRRYRRWVCMAIYSVWSRPFIARSSPLAFTTAGMGAGAMALTMIAVVGGLHVPIDLAAPGPLAAILYLGVVSGAVISFLWSYAPPRTTPTKVALSVTVNPVVPSIAGALLLGEPIQANVLAGFVMVVMGSGIAASRR